MPVPAGVLPDLVVVRACLAFVGLEAFLDGSAGSVGPGEVGEGEGGEGNPFGSVGQGVGDVLTRRLPYGSAMRSQAAR